MHSPYLLRSSNVRLLTAGGTSDFNKNTIRRMLKPSTETERCRLVNFAVTDGTAGCHNDNFQKFQKWRQCWHYDNS